MRERDGSDKRLPEAECHAAPRRTDASGPSQATEKNERDGHPTSITVGKRMEIEGLLHVVQPRSIIPILPNPPRHLSCLLPGRLLINSRSQLPLPAPHQFRISASPRPPVFSGWDKEDFTCIGSMGRHIEAYHRSEAPLPILVLQQRNQSASPRSRN